MEGDTDSIQRDLTQIKRDVEAIRQALLYEGELTEWAKKQLAKARAQQKATYTSHEDLRREIMRQ